MSHYKPFIILDKSTNKSRKRKRDSSESSDSETLSSPASSRDSSPVFNPSFSDEITSAGGFTKTLDGSQKQVFVFPTKTISPYQRMQYVREIISKLYNVRSDQKETHIDKILQKLGPGPPKCEKIHIQELSQARVLSQNVESYPSSVFKTPDPKLAPSTPGPRVEKVPNIDTPHTPEDSLKIINHLGLSDDDARFVRGISLIGLSSEGSVKRLRKELLGNAGQGWATSESISVKKWFRDGNKEIQNKVGGEPMRQEIIVCKISKDDIQNAVQHWASTLTDRGEFIELQQFENCPEILHDCIVLVLGNDSGQGFSREGVRFCNRDQANSGWKVFVTTMMQGSDKALSLFQKQALFSCLSGLRTMRSIHMGGKERRLLKFSAMDYEAGAEDFGTQVGLMYLYNLYRAFHLRL